MVLCRCFGCDYPDWEVSVEAPRGAAVLGGINEGQGAESVLKQAAGERVRPFTVHADAHSQDPLQLPTVF